MGQAGIIFEDDGTTNTIGLQNLCERARSADTARVTRRTSYGCSRLHRGIARHSAAIMFVSQTDRDSTRRTRPRGPYATRKTAGRPWPGRRLPGVPARSARSGHRLASPLPTYTRYHTTSGSTTVSELHGGAAGELYARETFGDHAENGINGRALLKVWWTRAAAKSSRISRRSYPATGRPFPRPRAGHSKAQRP